MSEPIKKVLANCQQSFTDQEKAQARNNIGALGGVKVQTSSGTSELVPDPEGKVTVDLTGGGGGGASYTAGNGIDITNDVISAKLDGGTLTNGADGLSVTNPVPDATGASQGDVLSVGPSGLEWSTPSGGGGDVFVATYGTTTRTEVIAAIKAGKQVFAKKESSSGQGTVAKAEWGVLAAAYDGPTVSAYDPDDIRTLVFLVKVDPYATNQPFNLHAAGTVTSWTLESTAAWSSIESSLMKPITEGNGFAITYGAYGNTYAVKVDGSTVTFNANGELQAPTSQLPSYSSANSGESLVVNGNGDGVEWDRRISGVMYNGASSTELRRIRINTYNNPSTPGLVAAFPTSGQGATCGYLMPDPEFVTDGTVDKVARVIENPNNSGVCMLEYQDDAAVISPLEKVSISTSTNPYEINAQPGKWYEIVCSQSSAQTWHIYLEANSTVTTNTVHTIVRITRADASVSCSPELVWHDERGIIHYERCDLTGSTSYYDFDCLVRKNGYTVEGTPWSFARVRRI